jgi:membrane-bound serine protease (ClpP class)
MLFEKATRAIGLYWSSLMRKFLVGFLTILILVNFGSAIHAQSNEIILLEAEGPVTPAMAGYLERGIKTAEEAGAEAVVLSLDTPGGLVDTTQEIVQLFRSSTVPIIVYVSPRGAQAASAGSIITMAGHAAAMAPETVIGAASPVGDNGVDLEETLFRKVTEDLKANVRNLTASRGATATALAEEMIEDARAVTAEEALEAGLIDIIADDIPDLLQQIDGLTVQVNDQPVSLATASANQHELPPSIIEQILYALVNPLLLGILLTLGVQAILIEISHPGGWVAGLVGVLAIGLALYGLGQLPVNWLGFGLMIVAFVLFLMEIKAVTHGALSLTGAVILVAGLLVLFNSPGTPDFLSISVPAAIAISVITGLFFIFVLGKALGAQRARPITGAESLVGQKGPVRVAFTSDNLKAPYSGMVLVAGELWQARSDEEMDKGEPVIVTAVDGVTLHVRKASK